MEFSWNEAPEWANYAAMDKPGTWYWYENKPVCMFDQEYWWEDSTMGRVTYSATEFTPLGDWRDSLQRRD